MTKCPKCPETRSDQNEPRCAVTTSPHVDRCWGKRVHRRPSLNISEFLMFISHWGRAISCFLTTNWMCSSCRNSCLRRCFLWCPAGWNLRPTWARTRWWRWLWGKFLSSSSSSSFLSRSDCSLLSLRMKKLKEEMEGVVKELAENNHFLERSVCLRFILVIKPEPEPVFSNPRTRPPAGSGLWRWTEAWEAEGRRRLAAVCLPKPLCT